MEITVQVVAASTPTQSQQDLDGEASELIEADAADGKAAEAAATSATRPAATVQAGAEKNKAVVTRFFPAAVSIRAGEMVTWVNAGFDPHVIALGRPVGAHAPENFAPPTIPSGAAYKGGFAISGVFGHAPLPTTSYALRFPQPGNYDFFCPIHPGMSGRVQVA
jgi:plastocyanin